MQTEQTERIGLLVSLIKKIKQEERLQIRETIITIAQTQGEEKAYCYKTVKSFLPQSSLREEDFEQAKEKWSILEPMLEEESISYLTFFSKDYPDKLRNIHSSPKVLYYKGDISLLHHSLMIAVVGSRKPTPYGIWVTKTLSSELAKNGFCIVSGMASGVDGLSHEEAIRAEGKTICVLGGSIHKPYPKSNVKLMQNVLESGGLVISEYSPMDATLPANFAFRNRIVSGLSDGVLITEAGMKSGTLITANYALEQGKTVFAVPGNINSKCSVGTNNLIREGAVIVCGIYDILEAFSMEYRPQKDQADRPELSEIENKIYQQIKKRGICHVEQLATEAQINIKDITGILNIMDIKGLIRYDGFMASMV